MTTVEGPSGLDLGPVRDRSEAVDHTPLGPGALWRVRASANDVPALAAEVAALRIQVAHLSRNGLCGNRAPSLLESSVRICDLQAGHAGWHGADNDAPATPAGRALVGLPSRMYWNVEPVGNARTEGEAAGFARAITALRDIGRDAHDGAPFQNIADAIADVSYAGRQVTRGHGRYLADAAIRALIGHLESLTPEGAPDAG